MQTFKEEVVKMVVWLFGLIAIQDIGETFMIAMDYPPNPVFVTAVMMLVYGSITVIAWVIIYRRKYRDSKEKAKHEKAKRGHDVPAF